MNTKWVNEYSIIASTKYIGKSLNYRQIIASNFDAKNGSVHN